MIKLGWEQLPSAEGVSPEILRADKASFLPGGSAPRGPFAGRKGHSRTFFMGPDTCAAPALARLVAPRHPKGGARALCPPFPAAPAVLARALPLRLATGGPREAGRWDRETLTVQGARASTLRSCPTSTFVTPQRLKQQKTAASVNKDEMLPRRDPQNVVDPTQRNTIHP